MSTRMDELIRFQQRDRLTIGTVVGAANLDAANSEAFGDALTRFTEKHPTGHLLLDMSGVDYVSSAILTEMIRTHKRLDGHRGSIRVCSLNDYVWNVFRVTNLDKVFRPAATLEEAVGAYQSWLEQHGGIC